MAQMYKRFENPQPGTCLLVKDNEVWKEPEPPVVPLNPMGIDLPSWGRITATGVMMGVFAMMYQYKRLLAK